MRILIAGGSGFIGSYLTKRFTQEGFQVSIVSRNPADVSWNEDDLINALQNSDVLINLAGRSINCRHTKTNKAAIVESRIATVHALGNALAKCSKLPHCWINASATAIYSSNNHYANTEHNFVPGHGFLAETVDLWEYTFFSHALPKVRQVALRTSVVLGQNGGAFKPLLTLAKFGFGGAVAAGSQFFSWIHVEDYYRIVRFCIQNQSIEGPIIVSSPKPLPQAHFMSLIRKVLKMFIGLPAPSFAVKIGAFLMGTEASLLIDPVNVYPKVLIDAGFSFEFSDAQQALSNLINK